MTPTFLPNLSAHPFQASYGEVSAIDTEASFGMFAPLPHLFFAPIAILCWQKIMLLRKGFPKDTRHFM
jgi:hypothetical protein